MRVRYSFSSRKTRTIDQHNQHRNAFPKIAREIVDRSDIILEVIDARFIDETRNAELEAIVKEKNKQIVYVINKSDLVEIKKLRDKMALLGLYPYIALSCRERRGGRVLRDRLRIESGKIKKEKVYIGVIGMPNTGKSSIINLLIGRASARTAAEAGFTKGVQKLKLSNGIFILDTPGVIPDSRYSMTDSDKMAEHAKLGTRNYDKVDEPEISVDNIMKAYPLLLEKFYDISAKGNSEILIEELGRKKHFLKKGNLVDIDRTARFILREWQEGKIKRDKPII